MEFLTNILEIFRPSNPNLKNDFEKKKSLAEEMIHVLIKNTNTPTNSFDRIKLPFFSNYSSKEPEYCDTDSTARTNLNET